MTALLMLVGALAITQTTGPGTTEPGPPPLTLEVPALPPIDPAKPTLFLIGDSTVKVGTPGQVGWGEEIGALFDMSRINVVNYARRRPQQPHVPSPRASGTRRSRRCSRATSSSSSSATTTARSCQTTRPRPRLAPGHRRRDARGDVTLTSTYEVVHTYGWYLRKYIADVRERGATPIVCSLVPRKTWKDGHIRRVKSTRRGRMTSPTPRARPSSTSTPSSLVGTRRWSPRSSTRCSRMSARTRRPPAPA